MIENDKYRYCVNKTQEIIMNSDEDEREALLSKVIDYFHCSPWTAAGYLGTLVGEHRLDVRDAVFYVLCHENPDGYDHLSRWVGPFEKMAEVFDRYRSDREESRWNKMLAAVPPKYALLAKLISEMERQYPRLSVSAAKEMREEFL